MSWFNSTVPSTPQSDLTVSILYDETTFYNRFNLDLQNANKEVIIESPFITVPRLRQMKQFFEKLVKKGVKVVIITKNPAELDLIMSEQSEAGIAYFEGLGIQVLLCADHHRKLAMIDRKYLWEGSLNILSQTHSREFMRRIESTTLTQEMFRFLKYDKVKHFEKNI